MFRPPRKSEREQLLELADLLGVFSPGEAEALLGPVIERCFEATLNQDEQVVVYSEAEDSAPLGWMYFGPQAPEVSDGVWELWWIGVRKDMHGKGVGTKMIELVEQTAKLAHAKALVIETSSKDSFAATRAFYSKRGFEITSTTAGFYGPGDDKVTFRKRYVYA